MENENQELVEVNQDDPVSVDVDCCSAGSDINLGRCRFFPQRTTTHSLLCTGRILRLNIDLLDVCPNRLIYMAVEICDENNRNLGFKVAEVYTGDPGGPCRTTRVTGFCFAIPGDVCTALPLKVRVVAQYVPTTPALRSRCV
ncbi:hypothetical protein CSV79_01405 [Sporosarcina sp. P13]|uniref:hypothetical protein n=1 Tax=Sporosarcina sp. P13 TaxID=2048263 RepID=UPI000C169834|nr:hypothetical protein [Sporosarcina sp. P13]PIC65306.1 hypothetical protein CSV79_01405 [Sporosarcina sp. P13]